MTDSLTQTPGRGRPVDPVARRKRARQILAGARTCFIRSGFHKASISEIAAEAGVSVANIYQYFENKDAMILALVEQYLEDDRQLIAAVFATGFEPVALRTVLESVFTSVEGRNSAMIRNEIKSEAARNAAVAAVVRDADDQGLFFITQSLNSSQRQGVVSPDIDTQEAASLVGYVFEGLLGRLAVDPTSGSRLMDLYVRALHRILQI